MDKKIIEFAGDFISRCVLSGIPDCGFDFEKELDGLYIDDELKRNFEGCCKTVQSARSKLSTFVSADFSNDAFLSNVLQYLDSVKNVFLFYFENYEQKSIFISRNILNQIIEKDMSKTENGEIRIGIGNPIVLESLVISYLQIEDFKNLYYFDDEYLEFLNTELIINKIDRLFRDVIVLYNKEFYRIIRFDENNDSFIAIREDNLSSIEEISAIRLYEKIKNGAEKDADHKIVKVLLIGSVMDKSLDSLKNMLKELSPNKYVVNIFEQKEEIKKALRQSELKKLIDEYDKIFILDCPEIYCPIELDSMQDRDRVIRRAIPSMQDILGIDSETNRRDFFNKNGFSSVYYRVQNYLIDTGRPNIRKSRKINTGMLDYLKNLVAEKNESLNDKKELYVYISNNHDFQDELYDMYNFTRFERYNSKNCRIIRFGAEHKPNFKSQECKLHITFYKLLKMLSNKEDFFNNFTKRDKFIDSMNLASGTHIFIDYGNFREALEDEETSTFNLQIKIQSVKELSVEYRTAVETLIREAFNFDFYRNVKNNILSYCFKKAVANVISGCAHNFNDLLFHHLYMQAVSKLQNINFNISDIKFKIESDNDLYDNEETSSYSYKRFAYHLMEALDNGYYNEASIINHFKRAAVNKEKLDYYTNQILSACKNLGYTEGRLYYRLEKYY
ncbi:MAG: hypothetical protein HDR34_03525 [Treponema sp.]|nr:hypothetical protein [Treponema sp.]